MGIEVKNICKSYGDKSVLKNVSLSVRYGESVCLMGPSGQGKTTLLHILMGLVQPDSGDITGTDGYRLSPVFQEDRLCENLSVGANLRLVCSTAEKQQLEALLTALGLPDSIHQPVRKLSGGMKRRVAIARALLVGDILLFDEPFKGLDDDTKHQVMACVKDCCHGKTLIWVTHDIREAEYMGSRISLLK